jgi:epoxyqueuosine reductase
MGPSATLKQRALEIGFDLAGVAPVSAWQDLEFARAWVERGFGGEMRYLQNPKRDDPRRILPSAKSVVCVGLVYNAPLPYSVEESQKSKVKSQKSEDEAGRPPILKSQFSISGLQDDRQQTTDDEQRTTDKGHAGDSPRAWISRYAWGRDYHGTMRAKLEELRAAIESLATGVETRVYVDTGPVVERAFARLSGIGWMGKNTCLINESKGSWFFIGVILTNLELGPDLPAPDRCGSCTRCLEACPTGALVEPYMMDASRCIAYFTVELKGVIPEQYRDRIGTNVFGCDICQDVCPWNSRPLSVASSPSRDSLQLSAVGHQPRHVAVSELPEFQPMRVPIPRRQPAAPDSGPRTPDAETVSLFHPPLEALASLTEEDFRLAFAHSPIKRAKYRGWLRNLCVAMGNSGDRKFLPWLEKACTHEDPVVREHAQWAAAKLKLSDNSPSLIRENFT